MLDEFKGGGSMRQITYREAINEAMMEEMTRDETVYLIGEFVSNEPFGTHKGLYQKFGKGRVRDTAVSENAIVGSCVGAALTGYRPIARLDFVEFLMIAADEMLQKAAKWRFAHGGKQSIPLVIRVGIGGYIGAGIEHSQCSEAFFMHVPGLKLIMPSTPYDAKGLIKTAIRDNNPVIVFEHRILLGNTGPVPEEEYTIPFGVADIKREGKDVTVVATGYMVQMTLDVASQLEGKGISVEVVDPRTLEPLDIDTIVASVRKTRRAVVVDEDTSRCGVAGEIAMQIMERAYESLDAPIKRVAAANIPIPAGDLEQYVLPQPQNIADSIGAVLEIQERLNVKSLEPVAFGL